MITETQFQELRAAWEAIGEVWDELCYVFDPPDSNHCRVCGSSGPHLAKCIVPQVEQQTRKMGAIFYDKEEKSVDPSSVQTSEIESESDNCVHCCDESEDGEPEEMCVACGQPASDNCICGHPLCYMHFELGAGFCHETPDADHSRLMEAYFDNQRGEV